MSWTRDLVVFHIAITQRTIVMRTTISNGEYIPAYIENNHWLVIHFNENAFTTGKVIQRKDWIEGVIS
jgi:hypothetical protein